MYDRNPYIQYKRDSNRLIYWLIHTSNRLLQTSAAANAEQDSSPAPSPGKITTPEISHPTILSVSKFIATYHVSPIPASIYSLFESVINARKRANSFYQQIVTENPDPEVEESNTRHKAFIDTLITAFNFLGGEAWKDKTAKDGEDEEDDVAFVNKYASLTLHNDVEEEGEEHEEEIAGKENQPKAIRQKGKKGKKAKGKSRAAKERKQKMAAPLEPSFEDIPLESYKIVDEKSTVTEYLLAVHSIVREMSDLRNYTQGIWRKVIEGKLNHAAAGAMCNMAVAVVKQLQFEIASDFPGNGSFDAILNAITRGNLDAAQGMFQIGLWKVGEATAKLVDIDVKECFMAHAYWDLLSFIQDFQKNRTGKPSKAMLAKLNNWSPNFDVKTASQTKRNEWRTAYTINWLYDLVLLWSSVVLQRKNGHTTGKPQDFILEDVDWSPDGKWAAHRVLWGPLEFAADITALAMNKPAANVKARILPHHVFQMQCIVDSFTISRGWSYHPMKGHVFSTPPANYDPLCDIKHFQDRPNRGINYSTDLLLSVLERDAALHPVAAPRHQRQAQLLPFLHEDFNFWLGTSKLAYGLKTLPPSRFSNTDSNGIWKYSPYLCGTGLADALEFAYNYGMLTWDRHPEPTAILHLYNMLLQTGHIKRKIDIFEQCIKFFGDTVFVGGKRPTKDFLQCWKASCGMLDVLGVSMVRRTPTRTAIGSTVSMSRDGSSSLISTAEKRFFKRKSLLALLKATNWRPEKIAAADIPKVSLLNGMRLSMEKHKSQQKGGVTSPRPSVNDGMPPELTPRMAEDLKKAMGIPANYTMETAHDERNIYGNEPLQMSNRQYLEVFQRDVVSDIYGNIYPLSAVSYLHLLAVFVVIFVDIEMGGQHFKAIREAGSAKSKEPRVMLVTWTLMSMESELLAYMGRRISELTDEFGCGEFSYFPRFVDIWDLKDKDTDGHRADTYEGYGHQDPCSVM